MKCYQLNLVAACDTNCFPYSVLLLSKKIDINSMVNFPIHRRNDFAVMAELLILQLIGLNRYIAGFEN